MDRTLTFAPKHVYLHIEIRRMVAEQTKCVNIPFKRIWVPSVPSVVTLFMWAVARGRTLTTDDLKKRGKQ